MHNVDIAHALTEVSLLLQLQGANPFRVRAYETAARVVEYHGEPLSRLVAAGADLTLLEGIGKDLARAIEELVQTGRLARLDELRAQIPASLLEVMRLPGLGPKKTQRLWQELAITDVEGLTEAARAGRIAALKGFGKRTEEQILEAIHTLTTRAARFRLDQAHALVDPLLAHLRAAPGVQRVAVAGSFRRRRETVGDIDLLATAEDTAPVIDHLLAYEGIREVSASGDTKVTFFLASSLQVDLRVVPPEAFGAALVYFTGSKPHNIKLRRRSLERDLRLSEYGLFEIPEGSGRAGQTGVWVAGREEADVYARLGLPFIPPELREDLGEIEAAEAGALPRLIALEDVRGDLQMHSTWSDGRAALEAMADAAAALGREYIAITDHSSALNDPERRRRYFDALARLADERTDLRVLKSLEVDIRRDGTLAVDDATLDECDVVLACVHSSMTLPTAEQTARLLRALAHPKVQILGHPTTRRLGERPPMAFDIEAVLEAAAAHGVALEINSHPQRLDLPDTYARRAAELGVPLVISTDAHAPDQLAHLHYGVAVARRAWLEPRHVLNTRPLPDFLTALRQA
jgi:DNA polymerase (family X)